MEKPKIKTAIPVRRYKLGAFVVSVLGEVESGDPRNYRYIAAVVVESEPEPGMYITAERSAPIDGRPAYTLRMIMRDGTQVIDTGERYADEENFARAALTVISKVLDLDDEEPYRLL